MVRDKFTGAPRGFAFVHFQSVADSARALQNLQVGRCCSAPHQRLAMLGSHGCDVMQKPAVMFAMTQHDRCDRIDALSSQHDALMAAPSRAEIRAICTLLLLSSRRPSAAMQVLLLRPAAHAKLAAAGGPSGYVHAQNAQLGGQQGLLRLCYARDRHPDPRPPAAPSGPAADALQVQAHICAPLSACSHSRRSSRCIVLSQHRRPIALQHSSWHRDLMPAAPTEPHQR